MNNLTLLHYISPLDQFGSDNYFVYDTLILKFSFISSLDFLHIYEFLDTSVLHGIVVSLISVIFFDDDDCGDSEWEDNDHSISVLQSTIFISNFSGMIPGVETTTSDASFTFFYSIMVITSIILVGFSLHNTKFITVLYPSGTPLVMTPFIIAIESVSYMARVVSLGMRLFANMFAGHSLVKILMSFAWLFFISPLPILNLPVILLLLVIFLMEVGIAYLQSYVFGALSSMYFEDAINLGH